MYESMWVFYVFLAEGSYSEGVVKLEAPNCIIQNDKEQIVGAIKADVARWDAIYINVYVDIWQKVWNI